jgi:hypothetical protein
MCLSNAALLHQWSQNRDDDDLMGYRQQPEQADCRTKMRLTLCSFDNV